MTQGDVTAAIGVVVGTGATLWAAQMAAGIVLAEKSQHAARAMETQAGKTLGMGALVGITAGVVGLVLSNAPNGLLKLIGIGLLVGLLAVGVLGASGLARVAGDRVARLDAKLSPLGALGRGAGLLIAATFLPVVGWFFVFPLLMVASVGAGVKALWRKAPTGATVGAVPAGNSVSG